MPHRPRRPFLPLAIVVLLALGDYLLWNWSLGANHDIVALVSGMTLIPLLIALVWLLVLAVAHLIARTAQRPRIGAHAGQRPHRSPAELDGRGRAQDGGSPAASPSSKIAA
ncbi:MAG TPA: hypothetical protein VNY52_11115 [Solirubrobacteraceae bacterium]|nr:hypothetical protein [Solirubrobacteraceae bacterium]